MDRPHLTDDRRHAGQCHVRWVVGMNRRPEADEYDESWWSQQCGGCRFWIPLRGVLGSDWGGCTNSASDLDGRLVFEHDGCRAFDAADSFGC